MVNYIAVILQKSSRFFNFFVYSWLFKRLIMGNKKTKMKLTEEERRTLKEGLPGFLNDFWQAYYTEREVPVDIIKILKRMNFSVYYGKLPDAYDGFVMIDENVSAIKGLKNNKIVVANSKRSYESVMFTLAHELAHYLSQKWLNHNDKDHKVQLEFRERTNKGERDETENLMDFIAASILMPEEEFKKHLEEKNITSLESAQSSDIEELASIYDTEYEAVRRRIKEVLP